MVSCESATQGCLPLSPGLKEIPPRTVGPPWAGWAPPPQQSAAQQRGEGLQLELRLTRVRCWGGTAAPWGRLTLTSQMLMPPSIPVVQNCEQLAFPPASTEIWLRGAKRRQGVSARSLPSPRGCPVAGGWEWGWNTSPPQPMCRDAPGMLWGCPSSQGWTPPSLPPAFRDVQGCSRDALGLSQLPELDPSICPTHVQGCSRDSQGCSGIPRGAPEMLQGYPSSWGWTPPSPPPTCRDASGMPRDAQGCSRNAQGYPGMLWGCSRAVPAPGPDSNTARGCSGATTPKQLLG